MKMKTIFNTENRREGRGCQATGPRRSRGGSLRCRVSAEGGCELAHSPSGSPDASLACAFAKWSPRCRCLARSRSGSPRCRCLARSRSAAPTRRWLAGSLAREATLRRIAVRRSVRSLVRSRSGLARPVAVRRSGALARAFAKRLARARAFAKRLAEVSRFGEGECELALTRHGLAKVVRARAFAKWSPTRRVSAKAGTSSHAREAALRRVAFRRRRARTRAFAKRLAAVSLARAFAKREGGHALARSRSDSPARRGWRRLRATRGASRWRV